MGEGRTLTRSPPADPSTWLFPQQKQHALIDGINKIRPGRALGGLGQRTGRAPCPQACGEGPALPTPRGRYTRARFCQGLSDRSSGDKGHSEAVPSSWQTP